MTIEHSNSDGRLMLYLFITVTYLLIYIQNINVQQRKGQPQQQKFFIDPIFSRLQHSQHQAQVISTQ